jgi:hypothetical protein
MMSRLIVLRRRTVAAVVLVATTLKRGITAGSASLAWFRSNIGVVARPFVGLVSTLVAGMAWMLTKLVAFGRWLLVPLGGTPFDAVKHYASLLLALIGLGAFAWAGAQLAYPPIVITMAKLPSQIETENWISSEIPRSVIDQIERMRAVVEDERNPTFQTVLNPPNIVVKTAEWSINIHEQILVPLGSLLGRNPGEVHLNLACLHPGCVRTMDAECQSPIFRETDPAASTAQPNRYLCLRLIGDIRRGAIHRRLTLRLALSNSTHDADTTRQMARVAEAVASVGDPATAALYFYRRAKLEGAAPQSFTNDPNIVAELRGQAFSAAEQADAQDVSSACWAHSVRAHLAIDRREFRVAEGFIDRARDIPWWRHLLQLTNPFDCYRLTVSADIALTRQLSRSSESETHPPHLDDTDRRRHKETHLRMTQIVAAVGGGPGFSWRRLLLRPLFGEEHFQALRFARAEVALSWFSVADYCALANRASFHEGAGSAHSLLVSTFNANEDGQDQDEWDALLEIARKQRPTAWRTILAAVKVVEDLPAGRKFQPLAAQAALDFLERLANGNSCHSVRDLVERFYLKHQESPRAANLLAELFEAAAIAEVDDDLSDTEKENENKNQQRYLNYARSLYERSVDIGDDRIDVRALGRLAVLDTAFDARFQTEDIDLMKRDRTLNGPPRAVLQHLMRAWKRFEGQLYPTDTTHHVEMLLAHWGGMLLASYPQEIVTAELTEKSPDEKIKGAAQQMAEYQRIVRVLVPNAGASRLAELPKLPFIGARIGCYCMLARMSDRTENATRLFLTTASSWRGGSPAFGSSTRCASSLMPGRVEPVGEGLEKAVETASSRLAAVKARITDEQNAIEVEKDELKRASAAVWQATQHLENAKSEFDDATEAYKAQIVDLGKVLELCHIEGVSLGDH